MLYALRMERSFFLARVQLRGGKFITVSCGAPADQRELATGGPGQINMCTCGLGECTGTLSATDQGRDFTISATMTAATMIALREHPAFASSRLNVSCVFLPRTRLENSETRLVTPSPAISGISRGQIGKLRRWILPLFL